jgi:hypothetical protein
MDEKKTWDDEDAPASSVRPVSSTVRPVSPSVRPVSPSVRPSSSGTGAIAIGTMRASQSTMTITVSIAVGPSLRAISADGWYATITRLDGAVLHEGPLDASGSLEALVAVPPGTPNVKVLIESSTKYKDAIVSVGDDGVAAHTFS